jgi:hypothetical protein
MYIKTLTALAAVSLYLVSSPAPTAQVAPADDMMMGDTTMAQASARDQAASTWTVGLRSFGPIRYGMTVAEAQAASGVRLALDLVNDANDCGYATIVGGPQNIVFSVAERRGGGLRILDVEIQNTDAAGRTYSQGTPRTRSGIGIGSTFAQVRRAYPGQTRALPGEHGGASPLLYVPRDRSEREFAVLFKTETGRTVSGISAGYRDSATGSESCF